MELDTADKVVQVITATRLKRVSSRPTYKKEDSFYLVRDSASRRGPGGNLLRNTRIVLMFFAFDELMTRNICNSSEEEENDGSRLE